MVEHAHRTLLRPGATGWAALNEEKRRLRTPAPDTPVEHLLREGEGLSAEAMRLIASIEAPADERPSGPT